RFYPRGGRRFTGLRGPQASAVTGCGVSMLPVGQPACSDELRYSGRLPREAGGVMVQMENQPGDGAGDGGGSRAGTNRSITLGGGCFWCTEAVFLDVEGVVAVEPGYAGGHVVYPTYEAVCTGETGHAEVVLVTYDPARIGLREIFS